MGSEDLVTEHYLDVSMGGRELIQGIKALEFKQCAFLLLRYCANYRISHLTRLSPPCETASAARLHDDVMEDTLKALLGVEHLSDHVRTQIHLRTRDGGLGLSSISGIRHHAFIASWADALRSLLAEDHLLASELGQVTDPVSQTRYAVALRDALSHLQGEIGDCGVTLDDFPSLPPKLQYKLGVK